MTRIGAVGSEDEVRKPRPEYKPANSAKNIVNVMKDKFSNYVDLSGVTLFPPTGGNETSCTFDS